MEIKISILNSMNSHTLTVKENTDFIVINNQIVKYNANYFIKKLLSTINTWGNAPKNKIVNDAEKYQILIKNDNNQKIISGYSFQQSNYGQFKRIINEVINL